MDNTDWPTTSRDRMLDALAEVLRQIPGIQYVNRQDIDPTSMVSSANLPAVVIDEQSSDYSWINRHGDRECEVESSIILDCQANATRLEGAGFDISTVRELMTARVIEALVENANLKVQLEDEDEPTAHAEDVSNDFSVRYPDAGGNDVRALITMTAECTETFDDRSYTGWDRLVADIYNHDDPKPTIPDFDVQEDS